MPTFKAEKCMASPKAGKNDCASTGNNSCGGTSKRDGDKKAWVFVPEGYRVSASSAEARPRSSLRPRIGDHRMATTTCVPDTAGIGLRLPHLEEAVVSPCLLGWLEIHPENFIANPHATELLVELSKRYPISVHTVGLSVRVRPASTTGTSRA